VETAFYREIKIFDAGRPKGKKRRGERERDKTKKRSHPELHARKTFLRVAEGVGGGGGGGKEGREEPEPSLLLAH